MRLRELCLCLSSTVFALAMLFPHSVAAATGGPITSEEGATMVEQKNDLVILDVRNPNEYVAAHYPDALNIPVHELETRFSEVPAGRPVLVHCFKGKRAQRAYEILRKNRPDIKEIYYINGEVTFN